LITNSVFFLAIGTFFYFLPMIFIAPLAGVLADRWNRKTLIAVVDSFQSLVTVWIIVLFYLGIADPLVVILINSLRGVCQAFHMPVVSAIIPTMVPKNKLSKINGIGYVFTSLIQLVGPLIGALLMAFSSNQLQPILWVDLVTFGIAMIPLLLIKIPSVRNLSERNEKTKTKSFKRDFKEGIITIKLIPGMIILLILDIFISLLISPIEVLLPFYISMTHLGTGFDLALVWAFFSGGMIIGGAITTLKKNWKHKIPIYFMGMMIVMGLISFLGFAPTGFFLLLWVGMVIVGLILPILNTIYMTIVQTTVPPDKMGRVSSVLQSFSVATFPIGTIIAGPLAEVIGIRSVFLFSGLFGLIIVFLIWRSTKIRHVNYENFEVITEKINNIKI